jgi:hypothetical protein
LGCNPSRQDIADALGSATASDNCTVGSPVPSDSQEQISGCTHTQTRTWTVQDVNGNWAIPVSRTITWTEDHDAPVINATGTTLTLGCNPSAGDIEAALGSATVNNPCGNTTLTPSTGIVSNNDCFRSQTRTWTATNSCNHMTATVSRTVTWQEDHSIPIIILENQATNIGCNPNDMQVEDAFGTAVLSASSSNYYCNHNTLSYTDGNVTIDGCHYSKTRFWHAHNSCSNQDADAQWTVSWVVDHTAPTFTSFPSNITLSACTPIATWATPTAWDECSGGATVGQTAGVPSGSTFANNSSTTITYTASDACGNSYSQSFTVTRRATLTGATSAQVRNCGYNISCNGASNGTIYTSGVSGGRAPYSYSWSPGGETGATATGLTAGAYTVTITDADGCAITRTYTLTQPAVLTANAGANENTYYGYTADQQFTHTATVAGGCSPYTYSWTFERWSTNSITHVYGAEPASTGGLRCNQINSSGDEIFTVPSATTCNTPYNTCTNNNNANYVNPVYPICSGVGANSITLMLLDTVKVIVNVTDANGCTTSSFFFVYAEDARCFAGNSNIQKVTICHRNNNSCATICVDESAVAAHLAHGDVLGACRNSTWCFSSGGRPVEQGNGEDASTASYLIAYPNPFSDKTTIAFSVPKDGRAVIRVFDALGKQIGVLFDGMAKSGELYKVDFDGARYDEGMYFYSITSEEMNQTKRLNLIR